MPLFVVLREGASLDDALCARSAGGSGRTARRATCRTRSAQIAEVPRTLSGKVLEVPVKRILMGTAAEQAATRESLANPEALDYFVDAWGEKREGASALRGVCRNDACIGGQIEHAPGMVDALESAIAAVAAKQYGYMTRAQLLALGSGAGRSSIGSRLGG